MIQQSKFDIGRKQLGAIYAKALLTVSQRAGNAEPILEELDSLLDDVLARFPALVVAFGSPRIVTQKKIDLLDRIFSGRMTEDMLTFLKVVAQHGRLDCLAEIRQAAHEEWNRLRGRVEVVVTSAQPLDPSLHSHVAQTLRKVLQSDVVLKCRTDPSIIGGLVVRVGDTVYDSSVSHRLTSLREQALQNVVQNLREHVERFATAS